MKIIGTPGAVRSRPVATFARLRAYHERAFDASLSAGAAYLKQMMRDRLIEHRHYIGENGERIIQPNGVTVADSPLVPWISRHPG